MMSILGDIIITSFVYEKKLFRALHTLFNGQSDIDTLLLNSLALSQN